MDKAAASGIEAGPRSDAVVSSKLIYDRHQEAIKRIAESFGNARKILITSEPYPDGDAFASELALDHIIRSAFGAGPRVYLVNEKGCPKKYRFLSGADRIRGLDSLEEEKFDVGVVVDGGAERTGAVRPLFDACRTRIYVDHHKMGSQISYDLSLYDPQSSSTVELIWGFFEAPELDVPLTREAAEALYLGIIFDTGSFHYSLTRPETHRIAANLLETGIDFSVIAEKALLTSEFAEAKLLGQVLSSARRSESNEILWGILTKDILDAYDVHTEDFNRVITNLCFVEGVKVAVLFRQIGDLRYKLSLRSRGEVDVATIARTLDAGGGGHSRAAGCTLEGPLHKVIERTISLIEDMLPKKGF